MLIIKNTQLEAFRQPVRKKKRDLLAGSFILEGYKVQQQGNMLELEDERKNKTVIEYAENGLLKGYSKPSGFTFSFDFDHEDKIKRISFPGEEFIEFRYHKQLISSINVNGNTTGIVYNKGYKIVGVVYPDNKSTQFNYGDAGQLLSVTDRENRTQTFSTLIEKKQVIHIQKDTLGRETRFYTNELGKTEKIVFPDSSTYEIKEDAETTIMKQPNGTRQILTYPDRHYRKIAWEDGNYLNIQTNDLGKITSIGNRAGTILFDYDSKQRLLSEIFDGGKAQYIYEQDCLIATIYPSGTQVRYAYDEDLRLQSISVNGKPCNYKYGANGTLAEIQYPNGLRELQQNKVLTGLQEKKIVSSSDAVIAQQRYTFDARFRVTEYYSAYKHSNPKKWVHEYDNEDRLLALHEYNSKYSEQYRYDAKGNIIKANVQSIEIGVMDEIVRIGGEQVKYDRGGNITRFADSQGRQLQMQYAADNTLSSVTTPRGEQWKYEYDGLGRRTKKTNGTEEFAFFWSGDKLLQERHTAGNRVTTKEYIYTDSVTPVAFIENERIYWLHADIRGAITQVSDDNGKIVWEAEYSAFGTASLLLAEIRQPLRLAGQYYDEESGLHYSRARYYSPHLRSFLSIDPQWYKFEAGNYSYAANDPYNKTDASGNLPEWVNTAAAMGAGVVAAVVVGVAGGFLAPGILIAVGIGVVAGAVAFGGANVVQSLLNGTPICWACAAEDALKGAAIGAGIAPIIALLGATVVPAINEIVPNMPILGGAAKVAEEVVEETPILENAITTTDAVVIEESIAESSITFNENAIEKFTQHAFAGGRHADLGLSVETMTSKGVNLVEENMALLKNGDNTLVGNINGIAKSFKVYLQDGKIMSLNMYPGVSNRVTQGTIINFGNVIW